MIAGAVIALAGTAAAAETAEPETWRGLIVAPEHRCSPYDRTDYPYPPSVEAQIVAALGGIVYGPYTGRIFSDTRQTDIEHIVAVSEAHDSGLCAASAELRRSFAADLLNLTLAAPAVNRYGAGGKCGFDAAEWLPPVNRCWFAARVVAVRQKYRLSVDRREADALTRVLSNCDTTEMVIHLEEEENPEVTVSFGAAGLASPEGAGVEVTVTLDSAPEREVTVPLRVVPGVGVQSSDYDEVPMSVTFDASETEKSFLVTFRQDTDDEPNEMLTVGFGSLPARVTAGTVPQTMLTITDDDAPPGVLKAWLARFGRTLAGHMVDAVGERLRGGRSAGSHVTIAGQRLSLATGLPYAHISFCFRADCVFSFSALADSPFLEFAQERELEIWIVVCRILGIVVWIKPGASCMIVLSSLGLEGSRCAAWAGIELARSVLGGFSAMRR